MQTPNYILNFSILIFSILISTQAPAQGKYPPLTNVITYEKLAVYAVTRKVEWINPNGEKEQMSFIEMAIPIDDAMKDLTKKFMQANYGRDSIWLRPRVIVFHAMGDGDLKNSLEISSFLNDEIPKEWGSLPLAGKLPNGAHFIIEKSGRIVCLSPPVSKNESSVSYERENHKWIVKRHQDGNPVAIGIENVTDLNDWTHLTAAQLEANAQLARWLIWLEHGKIDYVMSHHQFNDDQHYELFLKAFKLTHLQMQYRTRGRKDIGDNNLSALIRKIENYGSDAHSFFVIEE